MCVEVGVTLLVILSDLLILPVTLCVGDPEEVLEVVDDPDIVAVRYIDPVVRLVRERLPRLVGDLDREDDLDVVGDVVVLFDIAALAVPVILGLDVKLT